MAVVHTRREPLAESLGRKDSRREDACTHSFLTFKFLFNETYTRMDVEIAAAICLCAVSYYNFLNIYYKKKIRKPWRKRRWWMITMHRSRNR